ncbi:hypothetical protein POVCU1_049060 [Plasmodium ovale curtisi]|uniref:Uncharacterized protein n=1 Tax=Plasmodium ovale curtisi TaxID=864141 RepID=A0A1A8X3T2_PLAOA|nr:hypothetical protein POVCU1_049060 [Plasmodium ovale curtisi]
MGENAYQKGKKWIQEKRRLSLKNVQGKKTIPNMSKEKRLSQICPRKKDYPRYVQGKMTIPDMSKEK